MNAVPYPPLSDSQGGFDTGRGWQGFFWVLLPPNDREVLGQLWQMSSEQPATGPMDLVHTNLCQIKLHSLQYLP